MEAMYRNSKNSTFSSRFDGRTNSHDMLYTSPFHLSYSSSFSSSSPLPYQLCQPPQRNQPPLLALPLSKSHQNRRKINTNGQQLLSVRKSSVSIGGQEKFKHQSMQWVSSNNNRPGPDAIDVKPINQTYPIYPVLRAGSEDKKNDQVNKFSGSVVSTVLSPPPSSLPLPTFSLRPKLITCNKEAAAGIDAGATDSLRRILRIQ